MSSLLGNMAKICSFISSPASLVRTKLASIVYQYALALASRWWYSHVRRKDQLLITYLIWSYFLKKGFQKFSSRLISVRQQLCDSQTSRTVFWKYNSRRLIFAKLQKNRKIVKFYLLENSSKEGSKIFLIYWRNLTPRKSSISEYGKPRSLKS